MKANRIWLAILTVLVVISLVINGLLVATLQRARQAALEAVAAARNNVVALSEKPIVVPITVDQEIPFNMVVPIEQTLTVPLDFEYELSTVVNTSVNVPLMGKQNIAIPVDTVIPISYTIEVPIDVDFPISLTYHLQTEIPVEVEIPTEVRAAMDDVLRQIEEGLTE